ncbi:hypothetical protein [Glaciibacter flavus]|uniref:hypothetical protein n=1 Tax=Orlajensenia flava TaxID=2565934 RepID=UPI003AFF64EF
MTMGTLPDWIAAAAALGALFAAISAGRQAKRLFDIERGRDHAVEERRSRSQAESVAAWVAAQITDPKPISYGVVVRNASEDVVYDIDVKVSDKFDRDVSNLHLQILPPGSFYVAQAGKDWAFAAEVQSFSEEIRPVTKSAKIGILNLEFRDAAGSKWRRVNSGLLEPADGATQ